MPRRPSRLILTHPGIHAPVFRSALTEPPSRHSTLAIPQTPLSPPPRLHLRTIIPSPPLSPTFLSMAPKRPYPWIWRCHLCQSVYKLGVTRRCLEDGHFFCSLPTPPASPVESFATDLGLGIGIGMRKKGRRRKEVKGCRAEFDYTGWSRYNNWRRELAIVKAKRRGKEVVMGNGAVEGKDCWRECDFPSECHNQRSSLSIEVERSSSPTVPISIMVEGPEEVGDEGWGPRVGASFGQAEPSLADLWKEFDTERTAQEDAAQLVDVDLELKIEDLPLDCDLLHEEGYQLEYTKSKRRKSMQKIQQLTGLMDVDVCVEDPPNSPLKMEFSVDVEEKLMGTSPEKAWELEGEEGNLGCSRDCEEKMQDSHFDDQKDVDVHMEELLHTRSMFLKQFDRE